jgi:hypothetical protein
MATIVKCAIKNCFHCDVDGTCKKEEIVLLTVERKSADGYLFVNNDDTLVCREYVYTR